MSKLVIQHDLSKLSAEQLAQYLRDVSTFIGLDPDLGGLDTIWMENETGPGKSLVIYARRGTAEILRNNLGIEVASLTDKMVNGSIVFTATGKNIKGRQEIATGSKFLGSLSGKALDDAIMTSSTRALRRLTMQFTSLGILDESEVKAVVGDTSNPAAAATLSGSPMVIPQPIAPANNAPGHDVTPQAASAAPLAAPKPPTESWTQNEFTATQKALHDDAAAFLKARDQGAVQADIKPDTQQAPAPVTPAVAPVTPAPEADKEAVKPKRARRQKNTVSMEVEPETVSAPVPTQASAVVPPQAFDAGGPPNVHSVAQNPPIEGVSLQTMTLPAAVPAVGTTVPNPGTEFPGKPTQEQMADYRKKVSVYTSELPSSENMGSVQKMRAFITRQTGTAPQFMTTDQWEEMLGWFESFVSTNATKGLVKYINDSLGVK